MLQNLREKASGVVAFIIVGLLVLSFAMWGVQDYLHGGSGTDVVAKVDGHKISSQQVSAAYERLRERLQAQGVLKQPLSTKDQANLRKEAMNQLIDQYLFAKAAKDAGFRITPQQIDAAIMQIPAFQENGRFSPGRFQQILNSFLYTKQEFVKGLESSLLALQMQSGISVSAFSTPAEINQMVTLVDQERDLGYFEISAAKFKQYVSVTPDEVQQYYDQHKAEFMTEAKVSIDYVELSAAELQKKVKPTDQELTQYYQDNIDLFSTPAEWKVARILIKLPKEPSPAELTAAQAKAAKIEKEIQSGTSFAKLATQYSDDKAAAIKGGDMGWINASKESRLFVQIVSSLKPNQTSAPFQEADGMNIVKLVAEKPQHVMTFAQVKDKVKQAYIQQKVQQEFSDSNDTLDNMAYTNPSTLDPAAKALDIPVRTTGFFTVKGAPSGIAANPKIVQAAFNENVLKNGNNSNPITLKQGEMVVLRINQSHPSKPKPMTEVKTKITELLTKQKTEQQAEALGEKVIKAFAQGKKPAKIASDFTLTWVQKKDVTRHAQSIKPQILREAFNLAKPSADKASVGGISLPGGDYAVVAISKVVDKPEADKTKAEQQYQVVKGVLETANGQADYNLFATGVKNEAKIEYPKQ